MVTDKGEDAAKRIGTIRQNFQRCKGSNDMTLLQDSEIKQLEKSWFRDPDTSRIEQGYSNPEVAWVEADKAVEAMLDAAVKTGIRYVKGTVDRLLLSDERNRVTGVTLKDGTLIEADRILMATGAWTSRLMATVESMLDLPDDQCAESQIKAAGVCNVHFALSREYTDSHMQIPIFIKGSLGEVLPPPPSRLLKFNNSSSFTNTIEIEGRRRITCPPETSQVDVPETLRKETLGVVREIMPQLLTDEQPIDFFRTCWDAITPEQHQLITHHPSPHLNNVFMAVGGSFHSWKFLPTIGHYVVNVLRGISNGKEMDETWGWKWNGWATATGKGAHKDLIPTREYRSFLRAEPVNGDTTISY